jgi:hypothetical protein
MCCVKNGALVLIGSSWYYSRREPEILKCKSSFTDDVGRHNHPLLGPSVPAGDLHGITPLLASQKVPTDDHHGLVHVPPISGWTMALIPDVTTRPQ